MLISKKTLGLRIVLARKDISITQLELSKRLKTKPSVVNHWERGKFSPSDKSLQKLSKALSKPVSYFYGENNSQQVTELQGAYSAQSNSARIPVFEKLPESFPHYDDDDTSGFVAFPRHFYPGAKYIVKASAKARPSGIGEGDYCIFRQESRLAAKRTLLVKTNSGFSIKSFSHAIQNPKDTAVLGELIGILKKI